MKINLIILTIFLCLGLSNSALAVLPGCSKCESTAYRAPQPDCIFNMSRKTTCSDNMFYVLFLVNSSTTTNFDRAKLEEAHEELMHMMKEHNPRDDIHYLKLIDRWIDQRLSI